MGEGKGKWLVVHGNVERSAFNKMLKALRCLVHCQELTVKSAVVPLGCCQLPGEVGNWTQHRPDELLQALRYWPHLRHLSLCMRGGMGLGLEQEGSLSQSLFDCLEGCEVAVCPM